MMASHVAGSRYQNYNSAQCCAMRSAFDCTIHNYVICFLVPLVVVLTFWQMIFVVLLP
jgi:hypothetical protein